MSIDSKWYGAENMKLYEDATKAGLTACAIDLQGQAKVILTQFPRVGVDARLRNSITYKVGGGGGDAESNIDGVRTDPKEFEAIVGTNLFYASYVEHGTGKFAIGGRQTPWTYYDERTKRFYTTSGMKMCPFMRLSKDMRAPILPTIFRDQVVKYISLRSK
jgi:phage gpG-like protein